jgi:hypothetical protein
MLLQFALLVVNWSRAVAAISAATTIVPPESFMSLACRELTHLGEQRRAKFVVFQGGDES